MAGILSRSLVRISTSNLYHIHILNTLYKKFHGIRSELKLHCLIRLFSGGVYFDIMFHINVVTSTFYSYTYANMRAIMICYDL